MVVDRTTPEARPVDMAPRLEALGRAAAETAGFVVADDGHLAGMEVFYAVTVADLPSPQAEKGKLAWGVETTLRLEDEQGLGEELSGRSGNEVPYVRAAIGDVEAALAQVLTETMVGTLRDVKMQGSYSEASEDTAITGLQSLYPEERWAALRRLGELGARRALPDILQLLQQDDPVTVATTVGVLARLRDQRAIEPLVALTASGEPARAVLAADAIGQIGGARARAALRALAEKHPVAEVRTAVQAILQELAEQAEP